VVVAAPTFVPEVRSSRIPGQRHPAAAWIKRQLSTASCYLCHFTAKTSSMFSITSSLFFRYLSAPTPCSQRLPASFCKTGGRGITMLPESFSVAIRAICNVLSKIRTLCTFFCNVDPLFSSLYELFAQETPGVGG
jgi:hypothetical protein